MDYNNQNQNQNQNQYSTQQTAPGQYNNMYSQNDAGQARQFGPQQPHLSSQQGKFSDPYAYQPQGNFQSPYNAPVQPQGPNGFQIVSLVLGILSILCCFCITFWGVPSIVLAIVGIILAVIGNKKSKHGVGTGGLTCSIIGLVLGLIIAILTYLTFLTFTTMPRNIFDLNEWVQELEDY